MCGNFIEIEKIENSKIIAPYYPENNKCIYCEGRFPVDTIQFEVKLKNGVIVKPVCTVCLYEIFLEHPEEIDIINNIGEW